MDDGPIPLHRSRAELDEAIERIDGAPSDLGSVELIVIRPETDRREEPASIAVSAANGLAGDNWATRGSRATADGAAEPARQVTIMGSRVIGALATRERWPLAGDQLFVDLDLSTHNLPTGTRLEIGTAVLLVSEEPHRGCAKFRDRFGVDAARWVNADEHGHRRLRGINASVLRDGEISVGDAVRVER